MKRTDPPILYKPGATVEFFGGARWSLGRAYHFDMGGEHRRIYTVGHSTRAFDEFARLLRAHEVEVVADVRRIPGSRKFPHFGSAFLADNLPTHGIAYLPFKPLGGRRKARVDSPNDGWRNTSFRGYADFMQTDDFQVALEELMAAARLRRVTTMCAEAVPWRCHRSLISDALLVRGWEVLDIMAENKATPHKLTKFARVEGTRIVYPAQDSAAPLFAANRRTDAAPG